MLKLNNKIPTYIEIDGKSAASISIKNHIVWRKEQPLPTANYFYIQPLADTTFDYTNFEFIGVGNVQYSLDQNNWTTFEESGDIRNISVGDFEQNNLVYIVIDNHSYELFLLDGILSFCIADLYVYPKDTLSLVKQDENYHYFVGNYSSVKDEGFFMLAGIDEYGNVTQISMNNIDIFMLEQEGSAVVCSGDELYIDNIQYSRDYDSETVEINLPASVNIQANQKMYLKTINKYIRTDENTHIKVNVDYNIGGPISTLIENLYKNLFEGDSNIISAKELILPETIISYGCAWMFNGCVSLVEAPDELTSTTLADYCYYCMFQNCESLIEAPKLPATTLALYCYYYMFLNCTSLVNAPALPATSLADYCYNYMFSGCTSLVEAPTLPATTLAQNCYERMFYNCTSLINAPALPATTLANYCYAGMLRDCTSLVDAPALPATTLAQYCYSGMFYGCSKLVNAPALPATTLAQYCYQFMFYGCTSLVDAPTLPATTLAKYCYQFMFQGCKSLFNTPELPAKTLVTNCYYSMFNGCSSLTTSPKILAITLSSVALDSMFKDCSKLKTIYCNVRYRSGTTSITTSIGSNWLSGVPNTSDCTFYKNPNWNGPTSRGNNTIPTNWKIVNWVQE